MKYPGQSRAEHEHRPTVRRQDGTYGSPSLDRVFLHYGGCPVHSPQRGAGGRPAVAWLARSVVRLRLSGDVIHDASETDTAGTLILASCSTLPALLNPDATLCC